MKQFKFWIVAGLLGSTALSATTLTFSSRVGWDAAVNTITNYDFGTEGFGNAQTYTTTSAPSGLIFTDLIVTGFNNSVMEFTRVTPGTPASQPWYQWNSGTFMRSLDKTINNTVRIRLSFSNPVSAFGFNYGGGGGYDSGTNSYGLPASVTVSPDGLASTTVTTNAMPNWMFFGVTSTSQTFSFVDVYMNTNDRYVVVDDVAKALVNAPPPPPPNSEVIEAGTLLQLGIGASMLLFARRRFETA